jgi:hypothetical protein
MKRQADTHKLVKLLALVVVDLICVGLKNKNKKKTFI